MDNQRTLLFGREQWCSASNVGQFRQALRKQIVARFKAKIFNLDIDSTFWR